MSQIGTTTTTFLPLEAALSLAFQRLSSINRQVTLPLIKARGHHLAEEITAIRSVPFYDNSAVDGYGVAYADYETGCRDYVVAYRLLAGEKPRPLPSGRAVHIMTGASLPSEVDTVIMKEDCKESHALNVHKISLPKEGVIRFMNVRFAGEDVKKGHKLLDKGVLLSPPDIGLLASQGFSQTKVVAPLRIGLVSTGGEITSDSKNLGSVSALDCNGPMLSSALLSLGHEVIDFGILPDDPSALKQLFSFCSCDILISSGGMSLGESDYFMSVVADMGEVIFHGVAIKPGRPVGLGLVNNIPVFGLPGNPVAAYTCFLFLVLPILRYILSINTVSRETFYPTAFSYKKRKGFREFVRVVSKTKNQQTSLHLHGKKGAAIVSSLSQADGFAILDENMEYINLGEPVSFVSFESVLQ